MNKLNKILVFFVLLSIASIDNTYAQAEVSNGYNPLSLRQVHESYLMWKKTLWRRVDLNEKQNKPFFARNRELSRIIINAVKEGVLIPYSSDSVNDRNVMSREDFIDAMKPSEEEEEEEFGDDPFGDDTFGDDPFGDDPFGDDPFGETEIEGTPEPELIGEREYSVMEIKEDLYFDRIHSRIYFDIQAITLIFPSTSDYNLGGFEKNLASFRFIDLYNLFKSMPKDAIWYNENNVAQHKNLGDAFLLRLFKGVISKYSNADDSRIIDITGDKARMASSKFEQDLMNWESNLWEY